MFFDVTCKRDFEPDHELKFPRFAPPGNFMRTCGLALQITTDSPIRR
jgi:hypothetical protein